ncbi:hypothetical protein AMK29_04840 [Streptomyces sp. CB02261]|nr:hypothetical protein AMK29_04840 [Streptomyces sp. CB02261]
MFVVMPHQDLIRAFGRRARFASLMGLPQEMRDRQPVVGDPLPQVGALRAVVRAVQAAKGLPE